MRSGLRRAAHRRGEADGSHATHATHVDASLKARIAGKREAIEKIRADLPGK